MVQEKTAYRIVQALREAGWEAYIAGGAARDLIKGIPPDDFDVVTCAPYKRIRSLFKHHKTAVVGESFKVCLVDGVEVATYRRRSSPGEGGEDAVTVHDDLACRDFTINSMAYCPFDGSIVDDFGGLDDLKNKIIRFTGNPRDRILEDPCRIIRACRFLAKIEGWFDPETLDALKAYQQLVREKVAPERIRLEIMKALKYDKPSIFFDGLYQIGLLETIFPGLHACYGHDGGFHHNETIDRHSKMTGDCLPRRHPLLRLAGYLHDIGKPAKADLKDGHYFFAGHAQAGAEMASRELSRLKFSQKEIGYVNHLIKHHMRSLQATGTPRSIRKHLKALQDDNVDWKAWFYLKVADTRSNMKKPDLTPIEIKSMAMAIYQEIKPYGKKPAFRLDDLAINGRDVMAELKIGSGPAVGNYLKILLDAVIDNPALNDRQALMALLREI